MIRTFFEVDGSEMEGEGWCVSMLGFLWKNPWDHLIKKVFGGSGAVCATLFHPQIIK